MFPAKLAAVDLGSNGLRYLVAEFPGQDSYRVLETGRSPVRLGHEVFLSGKLSADTIERSCQAVATFVAAIGRHGCAAVRLVGTSALREADNGHLLVERLKKDVGVDVDIISGDEEARLVFGAVANKVDFGPGTWVLADMGGGSLEVSAIADGRRLWTESSTMGAVRVLEELAGIADEPGRFNRLLEQHAATLRVPRLSGVGKLESLVLTGGNAEALAGLASAEADANGVKSMSVEALLQVTGKLAQLSYRQRVSELGLREDRADVVLPAAIVFLHLAKLVGATTIRVPGVGLREGVALDLAQSLSEHRNPRLSLEKRLRDGAMALGRRFFFDEQHALQVCRLSLSLFDQLQELHQLSPIDRQLLMAAALLHDVGTYVSPKRHHRHSLYLISQSELPGLTAYTTGLIACIARYHRKSEPNPKHEVFGSLSDPDKVRVKKLAALLRIADALDREHCGRVEQLTAVANGRSVAIQLHGAGEMLLERWAVGRKSELFSKVFGLEIRCC